MTLQLLLLAIGVVAVALLGSRLDLGGRRWPQGVELLVRTGTPFIFVGILIGPEGFDLIPANLLEKLSPVVIIGFGWIGFLYGSHFEWRRMRRVEGRMYAAGLTESLFTLGLVTAGAWFATPLIAPQMQAELRWAASIGLGICAAGTAPAGVFTLSTQRGVDRKAVGHLQVFAAVDDLPAVVGLGVLFAVVSADSAFGWPAHLLISIALGGLLGLVSHLLVPGTPEGRKHAFVLIIGVAALCGGAAEMLGLSSLFVSVLGGFIFANLSPRKEDIYGILAGREHTLYAVFLIVGGALFRFEATRVVLLLAPGFVILRAVAKVLGTRIGTWTALRRDRAHPLLGVGLLFQGGLGMAIAVQLDHSLGIELPQLFMTTVVLAVVLNDLVGAPFAYRTFTRRRR